MSQVKLEKLLYWLVRVGAYLLPFIVLVVAHNLFFPFISGKNFLFRIIVEIMAAGWGGLLIINFKKYWPRWNYISIAISVFVGVIFLSAVFGVDFHNSFWSNFERMDGLITLIHLLALFFVLSGTFRTRREWFSLFGVSIGASFAVAFYGLLEYTGEIFTFNRGSRIISTLGNPLYVAAYLSFHIFLIAFLWFYIKSAFLKWTLAMVALFEFAIFFMTSARGAFVGILVGAVIILVSLLFTAENNKKRIIFALIILCLVAVPLLLHFFQDAPLVKNNRSLARFSNISLEAGQVRFTLWNMGFEAFKERPILGWGMDNFPIPFAKYYNPKMVDQEPWFDRTHNMPLEWLVTGGIIGFLAYFLMLGSIIPALKRGVKLNNLHKKSIFMFIGMIAAYLVQLLFVFDTLSTYLMLIAVLGFLQVASSYNNDWWSSKNTLRIVNPDEDYDYFGKHPKIMKLELQKHLDKAKNQFRVSWLRLGSIIGLFVLSLVLVGLVNVRPLMANSSLLKAITLFNQQQYVRAERSFQEALRLSKGTVGTNEAREHLILNMYALFPQAKLFEKPEVEDLYNLAVSEMQKQLAENGSVNPDIKHNILLAQLYHQWALLKRDQETLLASFDQYEKAIEYAPNYVGTYPLLANLLAQSGNIDKAIYYAEKALELLKQAGKYDERIFYTPPLFYASARRYDNAYKALAEISEKYSDQPGRLNPKMVENILDSVSSHGRVALPFLEKIYKLDNSLASLPLMMAQISAEIKDINQARYYAMEALRIDPSINDQVNQFLSSLDEMASSTKSSEVGE